MSQVTLSNAVKRYGAVEVLHGIDLEIAANKLTVLLGPSGCGKSTLLRMIAGLEDISDGDLRIGDRLVNDVDPSRRGCAMVFQNYALYPHQTVFKNMAFPLKMKGTPKSEIELKVRETAKVLELEPLLDRLPRDLSGGQRQRVAMGRAMIRNPEVFLFDEPLSNLDAELRVKMRLEIARLQKELGATMIFVTHDQVEAMTLADQVVIMNGGHVQQVGAPLDIYNHPANRFVAGFIGSPSMNFLPFESVRNAENAAVVRLEGGLEIALDRVVPDTARTLGVRPEHVSVGGRNLTIPEDQFTTLGAEHLGDRAYHYVRLPFGDITILQAEGQALPQTGALSLGLNADRVHFFDADGLALGQASDQTTGTT
ncbi:sn-glycerol-3-phosphate ABC transporter ATP-binding protein UgpC [Rhodobacteraceae bacterium CCMM004]|nr:sn-glycerol-3-phosphate ABC transporter ATP-binding protein UgpC [Rhodobacteraceae bacterium CCMM004]